MNLHIAANIDTDEKSKLSVKLLNLSEKPKQKLAKNILEEDNYVDKLSKIIERDYFPEIKKYKKYILKDRLYDAKLELEQNGDETLRSLSHNIQTNTPFSALTPMLNDANPDIIKQNNSDSIIDNLTLTKFLEKYTSEDNASFGDILERTQRLRRIKYPWLYNNPNNALPNSEVTSHLAIDYHELKAIINDAVELTEEERLKALTTVSHLDLLAPDANKNKIDPNTQSYNQCTVVLANTRMERRPCDTSQLLSKKALARIVTGQFNGIHVGKIGPDGKEILSTSALAAKPILEGKSMGSGNETSSMTISGYDSQQQARNNGRYNLIPQTPDVSFGGDGGETPLMTWGAIQATPQIHDAAGGKDRDEFLRDALPFLATVSGGSTIKGFSMPEISSKEKTAQKLKEKLSKRTKDEKTKALRHQARLLTPAGQLSLNSPFYNPYNRTPGSIQARYNNLSPAGHRLLTNNNLRLPSIMMKTSSILLSSRKKKSKDYIASGTSGAKKAKRNYGIDKSKIPNDNPLAMDENILAGHQAITDNLLRLPEV